jgi:paraquat-inducible protein B
LLALLVMTIGVHGPVHAQRSAADAKVDAIKEEARTRLESVLQERGTSEGEPLPEGVRFLVRFRGDVDGLNTGAAVRIRGFRVGTVRDVRVTFDSASGVLDVPVVIDVVPEFVFIDGVPPRDDDALRKVVAMLVGRGLRAQLRGSLVGRSHIALDLVDDAAPAAVARGGDYPEIPTVPTRGAEVMTVAEGLLKRLETLPIEELASDVQKAAVALRETVEDLRPALERIVGESEQTLSAVRTALSGPEMSRMMNDLKAATEDIRLIATDLREESTSVMRNLSDATEAASRAAGEASMVIAGLDTTIGRKSPIWSDVNRLLAELNGTARSLRLMLQYLERHPDAIIRGKSDPAP